MSDISRHLLSFLLLTSISITAATSSTAQIEIFRMLNQVNEAPNVDPQILRMETGYYKVIEHENAMEFDTLMKVRGKEYAMRLFKVESKEIIDSTTIIENTYDQFGENILRVYRELNDFGKCEKTITSTKHRGATEFSVQTKTCAFDELQRIKHLSLTEKPEDGITITYRNDGFIDRIVAISGETKLTFTSEQSGDTLRYISNIEDPMLALFAKGAGKKIPREEILVLAEPQYNAIRYYGMKEDMGSDTMYYTESILITPTGRIAGFSFYEKGELVEDYLYKSDEMDSEKIIWFADLVMLDTCYFEYNDRGDLSKSCNFDSYEIYTYNARGDHHTIAEYSSDTGELLEFRIQDIYYREETD